MRRALVMVATSLTLVVGAALPAGAAESAYYTWSVYGANPHWTGTATVTVSGFPNAEWASSSDTPQAGSGTSTYLTAATPFGAIYGSSQNAEFLAVRPAPSGGPSLTTLTFDSPTPSANWGFTLGDIDADQLKVTATDANGYPVPVKDLGFQGTFNYCASAPRPPVCGKTDQFTDVPTWNAQTGILRGNGSETMGASGWFQPAAALKTLTFTFAQHTEAGGDPVFQVWLAARTVNGPTLPKTGAPTQTLVGLAILLVIGGAALLRVRRRA